MTTPTLADVLPRPVRRVVYAVLAFAVAFTPTVAVVLADGWQWSKDLPVLLGSLLVSSGLKMAHDNT